MTIQLGPYLCRFSAELSLEKVWKNGNPLKASQAVEDELFEQYEDLIREEGEKHYSPELEGDYYDSTPEKYR